MKTFLTFLFLTFACHAQSIQNLLFEKSKDIEFQKFVAAIGMVESGNNDAAVGDRGHAFGRFQIWNPCFVDARNYSLAHGDVFDLGVHTHNSCFSGAVSYRVMVAYMAKYSMKDLRENNFENLARLWNSGPSWRKKIEKTNQYWAKVKRELQ